MIMAMMIALGIRITKAIVIETKGMAVEAGTTGAKRWVLR